MSASCAARARGSGEAQGRSFGRSADTSGDQCRPVSRQGGVEMIRLAMVDGQTLFRFGLRALVTRHPDIEIVAECRAAADAPAMVAAAGPDVVTVDLALQDGDGLRLARDLRDRHADL